MVLRNRELICRWCTIYAGGSNRSQFQTPSGWLHENESERSEDWPATAAAAAGARSDRCGHCTTISNDDGVTRRQRCFYHATQPDIRRHVLRIEVKIRGHVTVT